ncbi:MAG: tRNA (adenosine(37)-N6)-threonylcarbamoyltransferase complex dimerization subunit type 1 TsaB, partial [Verrucomicrobiae bacterium]|nr:tRNA (adenosine(37)-N6)-threonylcarbamoyltransferase complex dimerization subunit type 1 TsaB [Verrucomicrobiae bacterium]NNJ87141.1 tRNA (adenosine(37)-N6)-threonylcarbamoyltransferase complex dimerization subunit type 1 TsaB [Akkermansiaceae bacterium]
MKSILAIETSVPEASVALWSDGKWLYDESFTSDRNHNSMVFKPLAEALDILQGNDLAAVIVGTGPGSYSGTRTGIAAAQGLAIARNCPAVGLGSLAATPVAREVNTRSMAVGD